MPSEKSMQAARVCVESFPNHLQPQMSMEEAVQDAVRRVAAAIDQAVSEEREKSPVMLAVERRWSEICAHLDAYMEGNAARYSQSTVCEMVGELNALWVVTQYAGSNARTGWQMALSQYRGYVNR